jgi:hypothetical protein
MTNGVGFASTVAGSTKLVGVQIRRQNEVKLFRYGKQPVLRGTAIITSDRSAYLWTVGFTGREVPNPITIDIVRGDADLEVVLGDLLALTKLNFNSATFADGLPVTLRFADLVGEILTAGPTECKSPATIQVLYLSHAPNYPRVLRLSQCSNHL